MRKMMIRENEKGFLFKKAKFARLLEPGVYHVLPGQEICKVSLSEPLSKSFDETQLAVFRKDKTFAAQTVEISVADGQAALHYENGIFTGCLNKGTHVFWNTLRTHTFALVDVTVPRIPDDIPRHVCENLCSEGWMHSVCVPEYSKGLLYFDGKLEEILEPGVYYYWNTTTAIKYTLADTRQQMLAVNGQEILTKDKVNIRLNFNCSYRITDFVRIFKEIEDYNNQFYLLVQMTVREHIAGCTLDELLNQREQIAAAVTERLREKAAAMFIEIGETGIRDIILPGEVRDIMNTVLIAEKRAQANVITRREEVASTRSLLNTAKLMEENKTLYKLKELEYLEKICENVGNISVSGGDLLAQLRAILGTDERPA